MIRYIHAMTCLMAYHNRKRTEAISTIAIDHIAYRLPRFSDCCSSNNKSTLRFLNQSVHQFQRHLTLMESKQKIISSVIRHISRKYLLPNSSHMVDRRDNVTIDREYYGKNMPAAIQLSTIQDSR